MEFKQLMYVIEVNKYGSINKAAEKLYVSQPNISKAIAKLEEELNITIFDRNSNGVTLTREGHDFLLYSQSLVEQFNEVKKIYSNSSSEDKKYLNLSIQRWLYIYDVFYDFYNHFHGKDIEFVIKETDRESVIQDVEKGEAGLGVIIMTNMQTKMWKHILKRKNIEFTPFIKGKPSIFVSKEGTLATKKVLSKEEIINHTNVRFYEAYKPNLSYNFELDLIGFSDIKRVIYVKDATIANELVHKIDGYSIGVKWEGYERKNSKLKPIPVAENDITFTMGYIKKKDRELAQEEELFLDLFKEKIQELKRL